MSAEPGKAIYSLLSNDVTVTGLVSTRIYPNQLPNQATYPAIIYSQVSEEFDSSKDGPIPTGIFTYQFDIYASTYPAAQNIANAIKSTLDWYTGTVAGKNVSRIKKGDESDDVWEDDKELIHVVQNYSIRLKI